MAGEGEAADANTSTDDVDRRGKSVDVDLTEDAEESAHGGSVIGASVSAGGIDAGAGLVPMPCVPLCACGTVCGAPTHHWRMCLLHVVYWGLHPQGALKAGRVYSSMT